MTPVLVEAQIARISGTAKEMVEKLPEKFEAKQPNNKKKISKEVEEIHRQVVAMDDADPKKMEDIRKFSAIYGRFDCKRKPQKPLTLHEVRCKFYFPNKLEQQFKCFTNKWMGTDVYFVKWSERELLPCIVRSKKSLTCRGLESGKKVLLRPL